MNKEDYELIAMSIWRSSAIKDKNKVKQQAKKDMIKLITNDLIGSLKLNANFDEQMFLKMCGPN